MYVPRPAGYLLVLSVAFAGCATTSDREGAPRSDPRVITYSEIEASYQMNALEVIRMLRPSWLRPRGRTTVLGQTEVVVYVDGMRVGGPEWLRGIPRLDLEEVRFIDALEAHVRFGPNTTHGAIVIRTRSG